VAAAVFRIVISQEGSGLIKQESHSGWDGAKAEGLILQQ
jgi:hypothetical protein